MFAFNVPVKALLIGVSLSTFTACSTINPYTGEQQASNAVKFGAAGAVICGLIGAGENSQHARNAAAGCGAIGAGIGAYMDSQEAELRQELAGTGVQVQRNGDQLNLIMPGNITFGTDQYALKNEFKPVLNSVANVLYKYQDTRLVVEGHTDATGSADYNYGLSERRANAVSNYLSLQGVDQNRLVSEGFGKDQPVASNDSESGRAQNRRVELQITAVQS